MNRVESVANAGVELAPLVPCVSLAPVVCTPVVATFTVAVTVAFTAEITKAGYVPDPFGGVPGHGPVEPMAVAELLQLRTNSL